MQPGHTLRNRYSGGPNRQTPISRGAGISYTNRALRPTAEIDSSTKLTDRIEPAVPRTLVQETNSFLSSPWVMVYGIPSGSLTATLQALLEFGQILEVRKTEGNFIYVRFTDLVASQSAYYRRVIRLSNRAVVGVSKVPDEQVSSRDEYTGEFKPIYPELPLVHTTLLDKLMRGLKTLAAPR